ncbi:MAG: adenylosuccinate synthetase [Malacoplasma sp.]|nr:adenylosuccinate synthetase [Malacoplasma sp.]
MNENLLIMFGCQYGNEGKQKFVDLLANQFDYLVRYQNETKEYQLLLNNTKISLKIIPKAIFNNTLKIVLANGVNIDPIVLTQELKSLQSINVNLNNLYISDSCHIIFNFHKNFDELNFEYKTKRVDCKLDGIQSCESDKVNQIGIRVCDLFDFNTLLAKIQQNLLFKNTLFGHYHKKIFNPYSVAKQYFELGQIIKPYVINTNFLLNYAINTNSKVLLETNNGLMDDLESDPNNCAFKSSVTTIAKNTGIPITKAKRILGITKAYTHCENKDWFMTMIENQNIIHQITNFSQTQLALNNCKSIGWLDLFAIKQAINIGGVSELALVDLNHLSRLEKIKVCVGYKKNQRLLEYYPTTVEELKTCEPVYVEFEGWNVDISNMSYYQDLPLKLIKYIHYIEQFLKVRVRFILSSNKSMRIIIKDN